MAKELTAKQRAFIEEYLRNGGNGAAAYRKVYKSKASPAVCAVKAAELLKNGKIAVIVANAGRKADEALSRVADRYAISKARIAEALARKGFSSMKDYVRQTPDGAAVLDLSKVNDDEWLAVSEMTVDEYVDGRGQDARAVKRVRVKLTDSRAALVDLAKLMGYVVDRKDVRVRIEDMSEDDLDELARQLGGAEADDRAGMRRPN